MPDDIQNCQPSLGAIKAAQMALGPEVAVGHAAADQQAFHDMVQKQQAAHLAQQKVTLDAQIRMGALQQAISVGAIAEAANLDREGRILDASKMDDQIVARARKFEAFLRGEA